MYPTSSMEKKDTDVHHLHQEEEDSMGFKTRRILTRKFDPSQKLTGIPSLVNLDDVPENKDRLDELVRTSLHASHSRSLFTAVEELEQLSQRPTELEPSTILQLTQLLIKSDEHVSSVSQAFAKLDQIGQAIPRRVCQFPFKRNDIVWVCRTCQADETCVLCHNCFKQSNHDGHDVAFYHAQAGGCCDCGDPDAWSPDGFCPHHGRRNAVADTDASLISTVQSIVTEIANWLVETPAKQTLEAHERAAVVNKSNAASASRVALSRRDSDEEEVEDDMDIASDHTHDWTFSTQAASTSKSRGEALPSLSTSTTTLQLGTLAREQHGLYLILHADDVHTKQQVMQTLRNLLWGTPSFFTDSLVNKLVGILQTHGQLVVWGTLEVLEELTPPQRLLWLDGDVRATQQLGASLLDRAARAKLTTSIATRNELLLEQRAVAVLEWLTALARSCDPLCQTVAESILPTPHLVPMLRTDLLLSARLTKAWHALLLTLLAVPTFKSHLASAYCDTYRHVTAQYARGLGVLERSGYTLSVQFLNRVTYVVDLVKKGDLLGKLGKALRETLAVACVDGRLNPNHHVLTHRRYSPCISDLKCVLNVKGMARLFASKTGTFLEDWLASLALAQWMDGQVWRTEAEGHVEAEPRGWVGAFNASISLGSLFERLLSWDDGDESPAPESILSTQVPTIVELTMFCLQEGLISWQLEEKKRYIPTSNSDVVEDYHKAPVCLPYATVHTGTALALPALPIRHMSAWSFHLPLHRFVAACIREVCRRPNGMTELFSSWQTSHSMTASLAEFPIIVLSRAAQVRAGLWRRNGTLMFDQVLNYAEPPFCRALRDADILMVQFAALQGGTGPILTLLAHRFGIFDFCGLAKAPNGNPELYLSQVSAGLYPEEIPPQDIAGAAPMPWTFNPAVDVSSSLALLEEFLHLLIIMVSEIPSRPPADKSEHTAQAKQRLRREVIHRLVSGPKTHSELVEVHHVLSNWDNVFLSEEGKLLNPDDATGAALSVTLNEVAEHKSVRDRLEPNQWVLRDEAWADYDPAFYHISLRSHQQAAESRPQAMGVKENTFGVEAKRLAPPQPCPPHPAFCRLQRDITCDATVVAVTYRTLHVHCREKTLIGGEEDMEGLRAKTAYSNEALSETALARAVHLLTLGAIAWEAAVSTDAEWRNHGGSFDGSIFHNFPPDVASPSVSDWIARVLLGKPTELMDCEWYEFEDNALLLLKRLAIDGGSKSVGFCAQDQSVRAGAAWLCEFACNHSIEAARVVGADTKETQQGQEENKFGESELERKKREAKVRALERMNAQAARFAQMMQIDAEDSEEEKEPIEVTPRDPLINEEEDQEMQGSRRQSFNRSEASFNSMTSVNSSPSPANTPPHPRESTAEREIPPRLLKNRPVCIICNEDHASIPRDIENGLEDEDGGKRKRSRRRTDRSNALAFVGYSQASTVLKGGGGTPPSGDNLSAMSSVRRFAGVHVALCGHAVHSECCESYLATVLHREERIIGRREEFKCPLCQRLSNCLVPFIDVGADWIDSPLKTACPDEEFMDLDDASDDEILAAIKGTNLKPPLQEFLSTTPWWIARDDASVVWDGQSAFVAAPPMVREGDVPMVRECDVDTGNDSPGDTTSAKPRRRSVRSLRKKELYAAWSAMMKTPRFIRRRQPQKTPSPEASMDNSGNSSVPQPSPMVGGASAHILLIEDTSVGETQVWRRFMDLVSDMGYRADAKRLGEQQFLQYCGEFRHYQVEKNAYNTANRIAGRDSADWPACISSAPLQDNRRQELSREKLFSKLLVTIQSFTYSCVSETFEAKRLIKKEKLTISPDESIQSLYSRFGISGLACDDSLVLMAVPSAEKDDGAQPFNGRLGKLRYLGLASMAAAGAVSADLVQLVLDFPLAKESAESMSPPIRPGDPPHRAPVVFPILFGHVLTHVVAAICATCGRARARSDSLELVWPVPFSRRGSFYGMSKDSSIECVDSVMKDCEGFIKLGLLARVLQVLLGSLHIEAGSSGVGRRVLVLKSIQQSMRQGPLSDSAVAALWQRGCASLLEAALSQDVNMTLLPSSSAYDSDVMARFREACNQAAELATSYLSDIGTIYQILVPGYIVRQDIKKPSVPDVGEYRSLNILNKLISDLKLESLNEMLESSLVRYVVSTWFNNACRHAARGELVNVEDAPRAMIQKKLYQTEGFRVHDWPLHSCKAKDSSGPDSEKKLSGTSSTVSEPHDACFPMEVDSYPPNMKVARVELRSMSTSSGPLVSFSSRKSVPLIGGYAEDPKRRSLTQRPRIHMLPTSYTDLYAELGVLCPDSEQTALCLICGEVLNANGKGECTKHTFRCGAGAGIFFLLQECQGLIMHSGKAVYVQSPYVDSHGETPQYRGRPLNLDLDRYDIFRELWSGHGIRQKVVQERGSARQVIISDFY